MGFPGSKEEHIQEVAEGRFTSTSAHSLGRSAHSLGSLSTGAMAALALEARALPNVGGKRDPSFLDM